MIYYLLPARAGSKGVPGKNRGLFTHTADLLVGRENSVIVSSDDDCILMMAKDRGFTILRRPDDLAGDDADMIGVLQHAATNARMNYNDIIILLYLTHPARRLSDLDNAILMFLDLTASSLVCRYPMRDNPCMCISQNGKPIIQHGFYRRQDYPQYYAISHYIAIYRVHELSKLNKQLFNDKTVWMDIERPIDIDTREDMELWKQKK
jgi:N-acylneuraminate cytidylyltransferase